MVFNDRQLQISENTNAAIGIATGNYIAFADHDDTLSEEAFYQMAMEISSHPEADLLYSDEDIIDIKGRRLYPHFKSDYNPDLLCCVNYICHLVVVKRELLDRAGLLRPEYNGSFFAAQSTQRAKISAIFRKSSITGEVTRAPRLEIRMTSLMQ